MDSRPVNAFRELLGRLGIGGADDDSYRGRDAQLDALDAGAAAHSRHVDPGEWGAEGGGLPPNYVKSYDEGRPGQ
jgi:hypothetical protein